MPAKHEDAESERVQLARLALTAALAQPGIVGARAGSGVPRVTTMRSGGVLAGVSVSAAADGRYEIDLRLVADLVPLPRLADRVRARMVAAAKRNGLAVVLGAVNIEFVDLAAPDDPSRDANGNKDSRAATVGSHPAQVEAAVDERASSAVPGATS